MIALTKVIALVLAHVTFLKLLTLVAPAVIAGATVLVVLLRWCRDNDL